MLPDNELIEPRRAPALQTPREEDARTARLQGSVLVVDDCADGRRVLARMFLLMGLDVQTAENGQVGCELALAAIRENRSFDLIIMDMHMPVMDGYAATVFLRAHGYPGRIAALTADTNGDVRENCRFAGCDDFANKPINFEMLYDLVERNLQNSSHAEQCTTAPTTTHRNQDRLQAAL